MAGKLYVIGVGPGDPELLTLKAVRLLKTVPCIIVPKGKEEGTSLALSIVKQVVVLDGKEIIEAWFPMKKTKMRIATPDPGPRTLAPDDELEAKWNETVETVSVILKRGIDAAFITIGDPAIYSTFFYLYDRLLERNPGLAIEIVPGISSINAAAARAGLSLGLGNDRIAVLPANYAESLKDTLARFDTVVLMKVHSVLDSIIKTLEGMGLIDKATYISRAGMEDERIIRDLKQVKKEDLNYFSLVIVRK
jgi:precorrin-2/cobalt-factor-2 C20-methyltransferase